MTEKELDKILKLHKMWLEGIEGGKQAVFTEEDLRGMDLHGMDLRGAYFNEANLNKANLSGANLRWVNFRWTNLNKADLSDADLSWANLRGARNVPYISMNLPEGEFIAWKKVNKFIIKLKILEDSKRSRATTEKCRCDKAFVLAIENLDGTKADVNEIVNDNYVNTNYRVGEIVCADKWDDDRWAECSHGIHFFVDRQSAVIY